MQLRLAKFCDAEQLAEVHGICGSEQSEGFMFKLGKTFLKKYYQIFLNERNSIIIVAENENGKIIGFNSGTIKAEEHIEELRKKKYTLLLASIPAIIRNPSLLRNVYLRYKSTSNKGEFIITSGPRGEYWAWLPREKNSIGAVALSRGMLDCMKLLGVKYLRSEINVDNEKLLRVAQTMGANIVREFETPEGIKRYIMEYVLDRKK